MEITTTPPTDRYVTITRGQAITLLTNLRDGKWEFAV